MLSILAGFGDLWVNKVSVDFWRQMDLNPLVPRVQNIKILNLTKLSLIGKETILSGQ